MQELSLGRLNYGNLTIKDTMKLGYENKGEFLAAHLNETVRSFFQGGNHDKENSIDSEITSIVIGLSKAWDAAEEYNPNK